MTENTTQTKSVDLPLKKYYVYALIDSGRLSDPDHGIFYIGKGQNLRVQAHVKNAKSKNAALKTSENPAGEVADSNESAADDSAESLNESLPRGNEVGDSNESTEDDSAESPKERQIREIKDGGREVLECILGRFDTEAEAYAVESILIQWVYGRIGFGGILTNIQPGHHHIHIRSRGNFEKNERLDIPQKMRSDSGEYSRQALQKLVDRNIPEIAEDAVSHLREMIDNDPDLKGKIDIDAPIFMESGRYVGAITRFGEENVVLRLQFTCNSLGTNLRAVDENRKESRKQFGMRMRSAGLETLKNDSYGWLPGWTSKGLKFTDHQGALNRIKAAYNWFKLHMG